MATFIQGVTDVLPEQHLYQPDYNFLNTVMGAEQRKYDQGFNKVKSVYSSMLNSAMTNGENEDYRANLFKKLETQIRSISKVDLGQGVNVAKAKSLFDPLTNDGEMHEDMAKTAFINSESQKADAAMNSSDPLVRGTYSAYSREDIENGRNDLRNAKRDKKSIYAVQPHGFTAFLNADDYLTKRATADKFKIVSSSVRGKYLVKTTNGREKTPEFDVWAHGALGPEFDAQFAVEARVGIERQIKARMQKAGDGSTRADVMTQIAGEQQSNILGELNKRKERRSDELERLTTDLNQMEAMSTKNRGLTQDQARSVGEAMQRKNALEQELASTTKDIEDISGEGGVELLSRSMESRLSQSIKDRTTNRWALSYATLTGEEEIKMDDVWAKEFGEGQQNFRQGRDLTRDYAKMRQDDRHFVAGHNLEVSKAQTERLKITYDNNNEDQKQRNFNRTFQQSEDHFKRTMEDKENNTGIKAFTATNPRGTSSRNSGVPDGSTITATGKFTSGAQNRDGLTELSQRRNEVFNELVTSSFEPGSGASQMFYGNDGAGQQQLFKAVGKLRDVRNGKSVVYDPEDQKALLNFAKRFKVPMQFAKNRQVAEEIIRKMSYAMTVRMQSQYATSVNHGQYDLNHMIPMRNATMSNMELSISNEEFEGNLIMLNKHMRNADGTLKELYQGATRIGTDSNNHPIYDPNSLKEPAARAMLSKMLPREYAQSGLSGTVYSLKKDDITDALLATLKNNVVLHARAGTSVNNVVKIIKGEDNLLGKLQSLPPETQLKAIGNGMEMRINPLNNTTTLVMKVDPTSAMSTGEKSILGKGGVLEIDIPSDRVPPEYQAMVEKNKRKWSNRGRANGLSNGKIKNSLSVESTQGINYSVVHDSGQTYIHFNFDHPDPKVEGKIQNYVRVPGNIDDPDNLYRLDKFIGSTVDDYHSAVQVFSNQAKSNDTSPRVPFSFIAKQFQ